MAYRQTPEVRERLVRTRERIIEAALKLVSESGYKGASMVAIAAQTDVSIGLLYRYFPSKVEIFNEVFRRVTAREIEACRVAAAGAGSCRERLFRVIETFARRAFSGKRLAWALLVEPVDPSSDVERLRFRQPYRDIFLGLLVEAQEAKEIAPIDAEVAASAIVGAIVESLANPLAGTAHSCDEDQVVRSLSQFCMQAVGYMAKNGPYTS